MLSIFFFFFEAYCIVVFLILPFITSHKAFGFASTLLVAVSLIVFSICSWYSFCKRRLSFILKYPGPGCSFVKCVLIVTIECSNLNPGIIVQSQTVLTKEFTGPRSPVGNVSGYRCVSDCRSRGREFDPGPVPYFRGDWSWNNFYGHSPPFRWFIQEGLLSVTSKSMCTNYWLTACSSLPRKKCG